jgi:hypothetical protein
MAVKHGLLEEQMKDDDWKKAAEMRFLPYVGRTEKGMAK